MKGLVISMKWREAGEISMKRNGGMVGDNIISRGGHGMRRALAINVGGAARATMVGGRRGVVLRGVNGHRHGMSHQATGGTGASFCGCRHPAHTTLRARAPVCLHRTLFRRSMNAWHARALCGRGGNVGRVASRDLSGSGSAGGRRRWTTSATTGRSAKQRQRQPARLA